MADAFSGTSLFFHSIRLYFFLLFPHGDSIVLGLMLDIPNDRSCVTHNPHPQPYTCIPLFSTGAWISVILVPYFKHYCIITEYYKDYILGRVSSFFLCWESYIPALMRKDHGIWSQKILIQVLLFPFVSFETKPSLELQFFFTCSVSLLVHRILLYIGKSYGVENEI